MDIIHIAAHGLLAPDAALALTRLCVGTFFAISGFNKLFNVGRHNSLTANLRKNHIPALGIMQWFVPGWEFASGLMLALGFLSAFNAAVLMIICIVACCCEAKAKVAAYHPINRGDWVADWLYLPEVLYLFLLAVIVLAGTGQYSIDALIFPLS